MNSLYLLSFLVSDASFRLLVVSRNRLRNTPPATIHYGIGWPKDQYNEGAITMEDNDGSMAETFHVYSVEREKGKLRFFVDNILFRSLFAEDLLPYQWPFDEDFYFILNLAIGGHWPGMPDNTTVFPQQLQVDYVRVFDGSFPRIDGTAEVDSFSSRVAYKVVNEDGSDVDPDAVYVWSVPPDAIIESGQGTPEIHLAFGQEGGTIFAERATSNDSSKCNHYCQRAMGLQVKVSDSSRYTNFNFNCGNSKSCSPFVLNRPAGEYTCGDRIKWLIDANHLSEKRACHRVASEQNGICGRCFPANLK